MAGDEIHAKGDRPSSAYTIDNTVPVYGKTQHGIYHVLLRNGERDVLLLHTGDELWEFRGWNRDWRQLLSNPASVHGRRAVLPDDTSVRFPTQFEATGNGIVIVPQGSQAYFYDGDSITPLGFSQVPGAPQPRGPQSSSGSAETEVVGGIEQGTGKGINDTAYAHDGMWFSNTNKLASGMTYGFGAGNLGTTFNASTSFTANAEDTTSVLAQTVGWLEAGEWRCKVQLVDRYGNLSALSGASESVRFDRQAANVKLKSTGIPSADSGVVAQRKCSPELFRKQVAWAAVSKGPDHCIGRILYRTKDLLNSGDTGYYEVIPNATPLATGFATIPDNVTTIFPDNVPDSVLAVPPIEVAPVPVFQLCRMAFGRLWIGNLDGAPGMIRPSLPGRFGTFPVGQELYPDPQGGDITGLWRSHKGLMAFTGTSVFVLTPSDDGLQFIATPVSSGAGCVAPDSLQTLPDGRVIWMGGNNFYTYDGVNVAPVGDQLRKFFRKVTTGRLPQACSLFDPRTREYRCWVSTNGSVENDTCVIYDGTGWRTRTDTSASAACVTQDHRAYPLIAGHTDGDEFNNKYGGVYLLDHNGNRADTTGFQAENDGREAVIETGWMESQKSKDRKTARVAYLWLRETEDADLTIEVLRDWRNTVIETTVVTRYSSADPPAFYGKGSHDGVKLGEEDAKLVERRPFWTRAEVYLPSAGTFKFRIKGTGFWEFVGVTIDEAPRKYGGAQIPP